MSEPIIPAVESGIATSGPLVMDALSIARGIRKADPVTTQPASVESKEPVEAVEPVVTPEEPTKPGESEPKTVETPVVEKRDPRIAEYYKLQREVEELKAAAQKPAAVVAPTPEVKPAAKEAPAVLAKPVWDPDVYKDKTYEDYYQDLSRWNAQQELAAAQETLIARAADKIKADLQTQSEAQRQENERNAYLQKVANAQASEAVPADYHIVVAQCPVRPQPQMQDFLAEVVASDVGPQILYHLAKNPEEIARLNTLSKRLQYKEFDALETRFKAPATPVAAAAVSATAPVINPGVSKAPPPPKGIPSSGTANVSFKHMTEAEAATKSPEEYQQWMKANNRQIVVNRGIHARKGY